jgi:hypothetical protein
MRDHKHGCFVRRLVFLGSLALILSAVICPLPSFAERAPMAGSPEGLAPTPPPIPNGCEAWVTSITTNSGAMADAELRNSIESLDDGCLKDKLLEWWGGVCSQGDQAGNAKVDCIAVQILKAAGHVCPSTDPDGCSGFDVTASTTEYVAFDAECGTVSEVDSADYPAECVAVAVLAASPISLLFGVEDENSEPATLTAFPLDPTKKGRSYFWKASARAPLLVYDPEHTGKIRSGYQLFGEWAFGGRRLACLGSDRLVEAAKMGAPWRDGFEALGSLDADGDGRVTGEELASLGLWFDENRDGVSQPGEVKSLKEAGVVALRYNVDRKDSRTGSLYVKAGYERLVDGKLVKGGAVDWYGKEAESPFRLLLSQMLERGVSAAPVLRDSEAPAVAEGAAAVGKGAPGPFSGVWQWTESKGSKPGRGFLILSETQGQGQTFGFSLVEAQLPKGVKRQSKTRSVMMVSNFVGRKNVDSSGARYLEFRLSSGGGATTETKTVLSQDGRSMKGTSRMQMPGGGSYSYTWTARKLND